MNALWNAQYFQVFRNKIYRRELPRPHRDHHTTECSVVFSRCSALDRFDHVGFAESIGSSIVPLPLRLFPLPNVVVRHCFYVLRYKNPDIHYYSNCKLEILFSKQIKVFFGVMCVYIIMYKLISSHFVTLTRIKYRRTLVITYFLLFD